MGAKRCEVDTTLDTVDTSDTAYGAMEVNRLGLEQVTVEDLHIDKHPKVEDNRGTALDILEAAFEGRLAGDNFEKDAAVVHPVGSTHLHDREKVVEADELHRTATNEVVDTETVECAHQMVHHFV